MLIVSSDVEFSYWW